MTFLWLFIAAIVVSIFLASKFSHDERVMLDAMDPAQRAEYLQCLNFGDRNAALICPHCQTKGEMRTKLVNREVVAVSKTNTILQHKSTQRSFHSATQMHCDHCSMTWDV